jgi:hypothetical protein
MCPMPRRGAWVIDDWQRHAMQTEKGMIRLEKGLHPIRAEWFEVTGGEGMVLEWRGPGFDRRLLTERHLRTPPVQNGAEDGSAQSAREALPEAQARGGEDGGKRGPNDPG